MAQSTNNDVFVMASGGGTPQQITTRAGNDHSPAFSPDGKQIAYLSMETPGFESDRLQLMLYDRATRRHRALTADLDQNVHALAWTPDGRSLVLEIEERGAHNLYRMEVASGRRTLILRGGLNSGPRVFPGGGQVVFLRQTATLPPTLFTVRIDGTGLRQLTDPQFGRPGRARSPSARKSELHRRHGRLGTGVASQAAGLLAPAESTRSFTWCTEVPRSRCSTPGARAGTTRCSPRGATWSRR